MLRNVGLLAGRRGFQRSESWSRMERKLANAGKFDTLEVERSQTRGVSRRGEWGVVGSW